MSGKITRWALATAVFLLLCGAAFAQDGWRWQRGDGDHDRDDGYYGQNQNRDSQKYYQQGIRDGRWDRDHRRQAQYRCRGCDDRRDQQAYMSGYRSGYGNGNRNWGWGNGPYGNGRVGNGPYGNGPYGNGPYGNGPYGNGPYNGPYGNGGYGYPNGGDPQGLVQARNYGYQDGFRHGVEDRQTGHSFRPTSHDDYKHGDRGFYSGFPSKSNYKNEYRQGFTSGYQRGYYGR